VDRLDRVGRLEAEDAPVEGQLGVERAFNVLRASEAVSLALIGEVGRGQSSRARRAATISSAWLGGTTRSSCPWKKITGQEMRSAKWIGERSS